MNHRPEEGERVHQRYRREERDTNPYHVIPMYTSLARGRDNQTPSSLATYSPQQAHPACCFQCSPRRQHDLRVPVHNCGEKHTTGHRAMRRTSTRERKTSSNGNPRCDGKPAVKFPPSMSVSREQPAPRNQDQSPIRPHRADSFQKGMTHSESNPRTQTRHCHL